MREVAVQSARHGDARLCHGASNLCVVLVRAVPGLCLELWDDTVSPSYPTPGT